MTADGGLDALQAAAGGLLLCWLMLIGVLVAGRPQSHLLREAMRLLPGLIRLLRRLATNRNLPCAIRARIVLLMTYLALPMDLLPDLIPVLGYARRRNVTLVLRVVRRAGLGVVHQQWPGTATASPHWSASPG